MFAYWFPALMTRGGNDSTISYLQSLLPLLHDVVCNGYSMSMRCLWLRRSMITIDMAGLADGHVARVGSTIGKCVRGWYLTIAITDRSTDIRCRRLLIGIGRYENESSLWCDGEIVSGSPAVIIAWAMAIDLFFVLSSYSSGVYF